MTTIDHDLPSLSTDTLGHICGGQSVPNAGAEAADRARWQSGGAQVAEGGAQVAGAGIGAAVGGVKGALVGAGLAETVNRTGASAAVGRELGGRAFDVMQFRERGYYK